MVSMDAQGGESASEMPVSNIKQIASLLARSANVAPRGGLRPSGASMHRKGNRCRLLVPLP